VVGLSRGDIFWLEMEAEGRRPVCVITRDEAIDRLDNIVVATVSKHVWGIPSEVLLCSEDGMSRECAVSLDNLRTVPKALLVEPITKLSPRRIDELCRALDAASGC
jgi:mRNA interferase MazF